MTLRARPTALLVTAVLLAGCQFLPGSGGRGPGSSDPPSTDPAGTDLDGAWQLEAGTHDGAALPIIADSPITMTIDGSQVGGRAACNTYGGTIEIEGASVTIGALSMTEMGCDEPVMAAESAYLAALANVTGAERSDSELRLLGEGVELTYAFIPPVADAELTGTTWVLDSLVSGEAVSSVGSEPATLEFTDDGTLTGSTGCRGFGASYAAEGAQVTLTQFGHDDSGCPEHLATQDEQVLAVLMDGFTVAIDGNRLTITTGELGLGYTASGG